jgi:hypothetical protein
LTAVDYSNLTISSLDASGANLRLGSLPSWRFFGQYEESASGINFILEIVNKDDPGNLANTRIHLESGGIPGREPLGLVN